MTVDRALETLARKSDPCQVHCLRCCSVVRLSLIALAMADIAKGEGFTLTEAAIQAEVDQIRSDYPDLAVRFREHGCAVGSTCLAGGIHPVETPA